MGTAVVMRSDFSAVELRRLAKASKDANQSRRLLSLAAIAEGMSREDAARMGGMDRQSLRDWVHRFNASGPEGLIDIRGAGPQPRLMPEDKAKLAAIVEAGPDPLIDGVVRWRRIDLQKVIKERFSVTYDERYVGKLLKQLGFAHISARPRHPAQDAAVMAAFKKTSLPR
jgi:transposase